MPTFADAWKSSPDFMEHQPKLGKRQKELRAIRLRLEKRRPLPTFGACAGCALDTRDMFTHCATCDFIDGYLEIRP